MAVRLLCADHVAAMKRTSGLDLHPQHTAGARVDGGIVTVALSPGMEDGEAEIGGTGEESGLGGFSPLLVIGPLFWLWRRVERSMNG